MDLSEFPEIKGYDERQMSAQGYGQVTHGDDRGLFVEIYDEAVKQEYASVQAKRDIYKAVPYVKIVSPDGTDFRRAVTEEDKIRFPKHWAAYVQGSKMPVDGIPIDKWPQVDVGQVKTLKHAEIYTVEQLAAIPDTATQQLGMGYQTLKLQAQNYLKAAKDGAAIAAVTTENVELKNRITMLEKKIEHILELKSNAEIEPVQSVQVKASNKRKRKSQAEKTDEELLNDAIEGESDD
jgi:hypothetical protein